jgi:hypothetical protein
MAILYYVGSSLPPKESSMEVRSCPKQENNRNQQEREGNHSAGGK